MTPAALRERLAAGGELALLDVREQGVHAKGHPFFACSLPLSRLEAMAEDLLPRKSAPLALLDAGHGDDLAGRAALKLGEFGYFNIEVLQGGCAAWTATGGELFSGVNVPSKAFGEFVEHHYGTPRIPPAELLKLKEGGRKMVILDSRPWEEYHRMSIPGGIDAPGAELVFRVHDLADPDTLVVVNCAGRTRSIIGCQSLRNAGLKDVVALKDGTMGWELAGYRCEHGSERVAPEPTPEGRQKARDAAALVAARFQVKFVRAAQVREWMRDGSRTLYLLDVRSRAEFEAGHLAGSRHAAGGQVVQAADEYVGVRNARVVLIDPERVRSVMTASWLNQMGWKDVHVLEPEAGDWPVERGARVPKVLGFEHWRSVRPQRLAAEGASVIDLSTSLHFRSRHVPGAWWAVRSRLAEARAKIPGLKDVVLTSEDATLAHLAAPEAAALWPNVRVLEGGNQAWFAARLATESGMTNATTTLDDVWYKPYDHEHGKDYETHARAYLDWEVALVEQIKRDPSIRFRSY